MMETSLDDYRYRKSLRCLIAAISCAVVSLLGGYFWLLLTKSVGWKGLDELAWVIGSVFVGLALAACIALVSLVYGILCARERKQVLFWVVPLGLAAAFGVVAGLIQLILWVDETLQFIPGGMQDDVATLLVYLLGGSSLFFLGYWITSVVYGRQYRMFPWWSAPLWAVALTGVIFLVA